jgi:hypothetical protein
VTPREAVMLTGYIQACFPSQPINERTPDALGDLLAAYPAEDCIAAVRAHVGRSQWCAPPDVLAGVKQIRSKRIADHPPLVPPSGLTEAEERAWIGEARRRIGDGQQVESRGELVQRDVAPLRALVQRGPVGRHIEPLLRPEDRLREPETNDKEAS